MPGAGVGNAAFTEVVFDFDLEETVAVDHQVKFASGLLGGALAKVELRAGDFGAKADVDAGRPLIAVGVLDAGLSALDIEQVLKVRAAGLEAVGVDVRQIVGDHVKPGAQCAQAGRC
jgi:hypothetical protein